MRMLTKLVAALLKQGKHFPASAPERLIPEKTQASLTKNPAGHLPWQ
jgi:hypothetical protein